MKLSSLFEKHKQELTIFGPRTITSLGLLLLLFSPGFGIMLVLTGFAWGYSQNLTKTYPKQEMIFVSASLVFGIFLFAALIILTIRQLETNPENSEMALKLLLQLLS